MSRVSSHGDSGYRPVAQPAPAQPSSSWEARLWTHLTETYQQLCKPAGSICLWDRLLASLDQCGAPPSLVTCVPSP